VPLIADRAISWQDWQALQLLQDSLGALCALGDTSRAASRATAKAAIATIATSITLPESRTCLCVRASPCLGLFGSWTVMSCKSIVSLSGSRRAAAVLGRSEGSEASLGTEGIRRSYFSLMRPGRVDLLV
jgi:hypothetical protein